VFNVVVMEAQIDHHCA